MSRSLILVGNYGAGNIGDEALKEYFLGALKNESVLVVSCLPSIHSLPRLPFGFRSFFSPWWKTVVAIARSKALIFGGGTLFTDTESLSACVMWGAYVFVARVFRVPVFFAFQGVGPFRTRIGEFISHCSYRSARYISVRDAESLSRVTRWNGVVTPILTFDPAYVRFSSATKVQSPRSHLVIIPRHNSTEVFQKKASQVLSERQWDAVSILLMDPRPCERAYAKSLCATLSIPETNIIEPRSVDAFLDSLSEASFVLAERFHGLLASIALTIPFALVSMHHGDKFSTLAPYSDPQKADTSGLLALVSRGERSLLDALP